MSMVLNYHLYRSKVKFKSIFWAKIISGVQQGSSLGYILFNLFNMYLFLHAVQFKGHTDKNAPFLVRYNITDIISAIEDVGQRLLLIAISDNQIMLNVD